MCSVEHDFSGYQLCICKNSNPLDVFPRQMKNLTEVNYLDKHQNGVKNPD